MKFRIEKLEERIAPAQVAFLGTKAHHNSVLVMGGGWGDNIAFLGTNAHHNSVLVLGGGGGDACCPASKDGPC